MGRKPARFIQSDHPVKYMGHYDHALVHCPRCDGMAVRRGGRVTCGSCAFTSELHRKPNEDKAKPPQIVMCSECNRHVGTYRAGRPLQRLRCQRCGWTREPDAKSSWREPKPEKWARLWLEIEFRGERLWALNEQHLSFMEDYVAAGVRETGSFNSTIASRLPAWVKSGKNRDDLLRALAKLRARLN